MDFHYLTVFEPPFTKKRIGKELDGGYVICELDGDYDAFISGGIDHDISFEEHFLNQNPEMKCIAFDQNAQVETTNDRLEIIKKNIGIFNTPTTVNIRPYVTKYSNIFMKIDIEHGENDLFYTLADEDLLNIKQLVIEFHTGHQQLIPARLAQTHWLVHFHVNNGERSFANVNGVLIPNVFECTYIRKNSGERFKLNTRPIPDPLLDQPNCGGEDISITWPPFVN
jgi:hypothetical protein